MKRLALVLLPSLTLLVSGCVIVDQQHGYGTHRSALHSDRCPPGHRWKDGRCHATGKGNDPQKHKAKKKHKADKHKPDKHDRD